MSTVLDRLTAAYIVDPLGGCWVWERSKDRDGYGKIKVGGRGGKQMRAHRVSYELHVGPIPDGLQLDHLCRNRACINPAHLEPVTGQTNTRRAPHVAGPVCKAGLHERTEATVYMTPSGHKHCRPCHAAACATYRARQRSSTP